jgi:hypothetical protein
VPIRRFIFFIRAHISVHHTQQKNQSCSRDRFFLPPYDRFALFFFFGFFALRPVTALKLWVGFEKAGLPKKAGRPEL